MIDWIPGELPDALEAFPDNHYHAVLTDAPFGLSDDPPFDLVMDWLNGKEVQHKAGFLGRKWDSLPPGPLFWRELYRVMRPGALAFSFCHSRCIGLSEMAIRSAGFKILPGFTWLHSQGMALGADAGRLIDKAAGAERGVVGIYTGPDGKERGDCARGLTGATGRDGGRNVSAPATPLAHDFAGHHTRLRTCSETILVALKPPDGTWAHNAALWGCGAFNVEAGRVPTVGAADDDAYAGKHASVEGLSREGGVELQGGVRNETRLNGYSSTGRFPANVLLEHGVDCRPGACAEGCAAEVLARQGENAGMHSAGIVGRAPSAGACLSPLTSGKMDFSRSLHRFGDGAAADRFYYQARPSRGERSAGCENLLWRRAPEHADGWELVDREAFEALDESARFQGNPHPALKSLELTRYLARLLRQPGEARILVPFSGSGSEAIGAMLAGWRHVVAIDGSAQWVETARFREAFWADLLARGPVDSIGEALRETTKAEQAADPRQIGLFAAG